MIRFQLGDSKRRLHGYEGLVEIGFDKHFPVNPRINECADGQRHVNNLRTSGALPSAA
jgi:hypothetical protein